MTYYIPNTLQVSVFTWACWLLKAMHLGRETILKLHKMFLKFKKSLAMHFIRIFSHVAAYAPFLWNQERHKPHVISKLEGTCVAYIYIYIYSRFSRPAAPTSMLPNSSYKVLSSPQSGGSELPRESFGKHDWLQLKGNIRFTKRGYT